jgi:heptosyltransferase-2
MNSRKLFSSIFIFFLRIICRQKKERSIPAAPKKFLIIRQHNQFGDMLATIPLFKAIKKNYPDAEITLIASPENYFAVEKNKYIDKVFNFDKKQLWDGDYIKSFFGILRNGYDIVLVPVTVSISSTSCIMARIAKSGYTIGPSFLNGMENKLAFLFDEAIDLDWRKNPEISVSQFSLEILKPLNIAASDFSSHVTFDADDVKKAKDFLLSAGFNNEKPLVGFHIGAGKPPNRWPLEKFARLIDRLITSFNIQFYFTGSSSDKNEIEYMKEKYGNSAGYFLNRTIPELAAVIAESSLFITNDTGVMHVAGAVQIPQVSIFGPTNPNNWAPVGNDKFVLRKGESVDLVSVDDVYAKAIEILSESKGGI